MNAWQVEQVAIGRKALEGFRGGLDGLHPQCPACAGKRAHLEQWIAYFERRIRAMSETIKETP